MNISFALLSGGMSRRFGTDKTLTMLNGKELYRYGLDLALEVSDDVLHISRDINKYKPFIDKVNYIKDDYPNQCPLAGILTAINNMRYDKVFILSADSPLIDKNIFNILVKNSEGFDITLPSIDNKFYNLVAVYDRKIFDIFLKRYNDGLFKIIEILDQFKSNIITGDMFIKSSADINRFININTTADLELAKKIIDK